MLNAKLIIVGGDAKTTEVTLKFPCIIGRGKGATLLLPHPLVSRQHCEIFEADGHLMVRDLGSLNGTYVNNEKVEEGQLPPGQLLTIGSITFRADYQPVANDRVPTDRPTVITPVTAAMKVDRAPPAVPEEPEAAEDFEMQNEIPIQQEDFGIGEVPDDEPDYENDGAGVPNTPLFDPDADLLPPTPAAPMARPAPMAKPVPVAAAPAQEESDAEEAASEEDDDLNDFLNSLGPK